MTTQPIPVFAPVALRSPRVHRPGARRLAVRLGVALVTWGRRDARPVTRQLEATRVQSLRLAADHGPH